MYLPGYIAIQVFKFKNYIFCLLVKKIKQPSNRKYTIVYSILSIGIDNMHVKIERIY